MAKVGGMLMILICMDIKMPAESKKLSKITLSLEKSDNMKIPTGFYGKR